MERELTKGKTKIAEHRLATKAAEQRARYAREAMEMLTLAMKVPSGDTIREHFLMLAHTAQLFAADAHRQMVFYRDGFAVFRNERICHLSEAEAAKLIRAEQERALHPAVRVRLRLKRNKLKKEQAQ
jgi:hypothetical protein